MRITVPKPKKRITRRGSPIFRPVTICLVFGAASVEARTGWCALVYVRVASPLAKPSQHNHNDVLVSSSRRADDVPGITRERRRECLYVTIGPLCL